MRTVLFCALALAAGSVLAWEVEPVWSRPLGGHSMSGTGLFDIDGDRVPELLVPGNSTLYCYDTAGIQRWTFRPMSNYFPAVSSPVAADINGDGTVEVVVSTPLAVYALSAVGDSLWRRVLAGQGSVQNCISSVALGDVNRDSMLEVFCYEVYANRLLCLSPLDGETIWTYTPGGSPMFSVGTPTVADVNCDDRLEVVGQVAWTGGGGQLYCLSDSGRELWHFDTPGSGIGGWHCGSAAVADVNRDDSLEVVTTVNYWGAVCVSSQGRQIWRRSISEHAAAYPAIGDIDCDDTLEVVTALGPSIRCFHAPSGRDKWTYTVATGYYIVSSPALSDLDGDDSLEVVFAEAKQNNPSDSTRPAWILDCHGQALWNDTTGTTMADPTCGDVSGDGRVEFFVGPTMPGGYFYWYRLDTAAVTPGRVDWPTLQHDIWRTGWYEYEGPRVGVAEEEVQGFEGSGGRVRVWPNPFTTRLNIGAAAGTRVGIYDAGGRLVARLEPGRGHATWDATAAPGGVYFCRPGAEAGVRAVKVSR